MTAHSDPVSASPMARSVGACMACLTVGFLVCTATYLLRGVDFGPLRTLVAFEDGLYSTLVPPSLQLGTGFHRIVFVDIDDSALAGWDGPASVAGRTPRGLIAKLTSIARQAKASVVFLDYDFRDAMPDDNELAHELANTSATPVLLPRLFASRALPPCGSQRDDTAPYEQRTVFDNVANTNSVFYVHAIIALGAYGSVEGMCSFYKIRVGANSEPVERRASMLRATEIAPPVDHRRGLSDSARPIATRWWVDDHTNVIYDRSHKVVYARVKPVISEHRDAIDKAGLDLSVFEGAYVIIGTTHNQPADIFSTPVGELPGAVVQANLGIELQSPEQGEVPLIIQFLVDLFLIAISAVLTIPICWHPIYRKLPPGSRLSTKARLSRLAREGLVIIFFGITVACSFVFLVWVFGDCLAGWRFGMLSFAIGAIIVLSIEVVSAIADAASEVTQAVAMRLSSRRSNL